MARKPSTPQAPCRARGAAPHTIERAGQQQTPHDKTGRRIFLERVLTRDATHFSNVAQLVEQRRWCRAPLKAADVARRGRAPTAARTPVKLALTTATEAQPLTSLVRSHASRRKLSNGGRGPAPRQ